LTADPQRNVVEPPPTQPEVWPPFFNALAAIRPVLRFNMGLALKFVNDMGPARDALATAAIEAQEQGNVHLIALAFGHLGEAERLQGHWRAALDTCARGLAAVQHLVNELPPLAGILLAQEGVTRYELGQTSVAEQLWLHAIELAEPWGNWEALLPAYIGVARLRGFVRRDVDGARDALATLRDLTRPHAEVVFPLTEAYERAISAQMSSGYSLTVTPAAPSALPYYGADPLRSAGPAASRHLPTSLARPQPMPLRSNRRTAGQRASLPYPRNGGPFALAAAGLARRRSRRDDAQPEASQRHFGMRSGRLGTVAARHCSGATLPEAVARQTQLIVATSGAR
jgi:hypothetical protein